MSAVLQPAPPVAVEPDANLLNAVVKQRAELKLQLEAETKAQNVREKKLKAQIAEIDAVLLRVLNDDTLPTYKSMQGGTIGTTTRTKYNVRDRAAFEAWVRQTGDLTMFSNTLAKKVMDDYVKDHNKLPPGCGAFVERSITHNKTTNK